MSRQMWWPKPRSNPMAANEALALMPAGLPPVEPELAAPCPRPMVWTARPWSHGSIAAGDIALLREGVAVRAWITSARVERDSEGPDIRATFAYLDGGDRGALHQGAFFGSYDAVHLVLGFPDLARWLSRTMRPGGTLTVLFPRSEPRAHRIYGAMELYLERRLTDVIDAVQGAPTAADRAQRLDELAALLRGPIGTLGCDYDDFRRYLDLTARISGIATTDRTPLVEVVEAAIEAVGAGRHDAGPVGELAGLCGKYMPGLWAAS